MELVGDDDRLVSLAGLLPLRLLAERAGLTAGLSAAMARPDFTPVYNRGRVLLDLALVLIAGGYCTTGPRPRPCPTRPDHDPPSLRPWKGRRPERRSGDPATAGH